MRNQQENNRNYTEVVVEDDGTQDQRDGSHIEVQSIHFFQDIHERRRISHQDWPNIGSNGRPMNTIPNLKHLLDHYDIEVSYNEISKEIEVDFDGADFEGACAAEAKHAFILSLLALNEMPRSEFEPYLMAIGAANPRNPVMDFICSKPWDGQSRLQDLADTLLTRDAFCEKTKMFLLRRWLISAAAAAAMKRDFHCRGVLVLQGPQSIGKTSWFKALLPPGINDVLKVDLVVSPYDKDSIISASRHWMCELGELDALFKRVDVARLNVFITSPTEDIRLPYGTRSMKFPRKTVFFASVNPQAFLKDETGSTRWWTIPVTRVVVDHGIDMQQLWAEVYTLFRAREQWWLTDAEEAHLEENNDSFRASMPIEDLIRAHFDLEHHEVAEELTSTQVLRTVGFDMPTKEQASDCGRILNRLCKHLGTQRRNKYGMVYPLPRKRGPHND